MINILESKYIVIVWWLVFIFLLPWDQEKIVVINLIIFCYFLHYMVASTLEDTFEQRKNAIRQTITETIAKRISMYLSLLSEIKEVVTSFNVIILGIANTMKASKTFMYKEQNLGREKYNFLIAINNTLRILSNTCLKKELGKNLVTARLLINSIKPEDSSFVDQK